MHPSNIDKVFYHLVDNGTLKGLSATYVENIIPDGESDFQNVANRTKEQLKISDNLSFSTEFTGSGWIARRMESSQQTNTFLDRAGTLDPYYNIPQILFCPWKNRLAF